MPESRRSPGYECVRGEGPSNPNQPASVHTDATSPIAAPVFVHVLGFDFGERRIGVALGNRISARARALEVVANGNAGPDWARLAMIVREWRPDALLVGLPLTLDSGEQAASQRARAFAAALQARFKLPVLFIDERLSSREAAQRFAARRAQGSARRKHAAALDALAAEIIVEQWLREGTIPPSHI